MDRLDAMAVFTAIAAEGTLSAASRKLGVPLATVSRKLSDLEQHLNTRLVRRSTRKLVLTDAGRDYLAACLQILEQVEEAERTASGAYANAKGQLVITGPTVFGRMHVTPVVAEFLEAYPQVDVTLLLIDRVIDLLEEKVDLALRIGHLRDSGLVGIPIGAVRLVTCASPAYLERFGTPSSPAELNGHRCVMFEREATTTTGWKFPHAGRSQPASVRSRLLVNTAEAAIAAALAGAGITRVLSYQVAEALSAGRLIRILTDDEPPPVPITLLHPGQGRLPMKARVFVEFATERLRERVAAAGRKPIPRSR